MNIPRGHAGETDICMAIRFEKAASEVRSPEDREYLLQVARSLRTASDARTQQLSKLADDLFWSET